MDLTRTLLEWLIVNGPATLALVAFICALGIPLPIPVLIIGAGALIRQGHITPHTAILVTLAGALLAEMVYYSVGRQLGPPARGRMNPRFASAYYEAERRFNQHPGLTVYLTRWLIPPIGIPVNLIAGATAFPLRRFVATSVLGNAMWVFAYTAIGYALGNDLQRVSPVIDRYKLWFAGAALTIGVAILLYRYRLAVRRLWRAAIAAATPKPAVVEPAKITDPTDHTRR